MKKALFILAIAVILITTLSAIACGGNSNNASNDYTAHSRTIIDQTVTIASGNSWYTELAPGDYDVTLNSDDGVTVQWIGGGVDQGYNTNGAVTEYIKRSVPVFQTTTFKIYNHTGFFSNPTAILRLRIVQAQ